MFFSLFFFLFFYSSVLFSFFLIGDAVHVHVDVKTWAENSDLGLQCVHMCARHGNVDLLKLLVTKLVFFYALFFLHTSFPLRQSFCCCCCFSFVAGCVRSSSFCLVVDSICVCMCVCASKTKNSYNVQLSALTKFHQSAVHLAAGAGHDKIVQYLWDQKVDFHIGWIYLFFVCFFLLLLLFVVAVVVVVVVVVVVAAAARYDAFCSLTDELFFN